MGGEKNKTLDLFGADFEKLSNKDKVDRLLKVIEVESMKPESEIVQDLVNECSEFIKELAPEDTTFASEDEFMEKWSELQKLSAEIETENDSQDTVVYIKTKPRRVYARDCNYL